MLNITGELRCHGLQSKPCENNERTVARGTNIKHKYPVVAPCKRITPVFTPLRYSYVNSGKGVAPSPSTPSAGTLPPFLPRPLRIHIPPRFECIYCHLIVSSRHPHNCSRLGAGRTLQNRWNPWNMLCYPALAPAMNDSGGGRNTHEYPVSGPRLYQFLVNAEYLFRGVQLLTTSSTQDRHARESGSRHRWVPYSVEDSLL